MTEHQRKGTTDFDRLVMELEQKIAKQERELYSDVVIQETHHPVTWDGWLGRMFMGS